MELLLVDKQKEKLEKILIEKGISLDDYLTMLVKADINSIYNLGNGYYFNFYLNKLFNKYEEEVELTNIQKEVLKYLIKNNEVINSTEEIYRNCWSKRKKFSIFTVRNIVKKIRDKTYYYIIKNSHNNGYLVYNEKDSK